MNVAQSVQQWTNGAPCHCMQQHRTRLLCSILFDLLNEHRWAQAMSFRFFPRDDFKCPDLSKSFEFIQPWRGIILDQLFYTHAVPDYRTGFHLFRQFRTFRDDSCKFCRWSTTSRSREFRIHSEYHGRCRHPCVGIQCIIDCTKNVGQSITWAQIRHIDYELVVDWAYNCMTSFKESNPFMSFGRNTFQNDSPFVASLFEFSPGEVRSLIMYKHVRSSSVQVNLAKSTDSPCLCTWWFMDEHAVLKQSTRAYHM